MKILGFKFCWHKWPLYGDHPPIKQDFVAWPRYVTWFKCYKCGDRKLKACDDMGMRR